MRETSNPRRPFLIFFTLSGLFALSQFYCVSSVVIAPNLIRDLGLSAETLGILGGAYFYSFAILQIPVGPLLDRIGPRIIISSFYWPLERLWIRMVLRFLLILSGKS